MLMVIIQCHRYVGGSCQQDGGFPRIYFFYAFDLMVMAVPNVLQQLCYSQRLWLWVLIVLARVEVAFVTWE